MPMSSQAARALRAKKKLNPSTKTAFDEGYLRTPVAAVWQGEDAGSPSLEDSRPRPARGSIARLRPPLAVRAGVCVLAQMRHGELYVGMGSTVRPVWVRAVEVLSGAERREVVGRMGPMRK